MDAGEVVLSSSDVVGLSYSVAGLGCILDNLLLGVVGTYKRAELVVSGTVSILRELDRLLDNGCNILVDHSLAVYDLKHYAALSEVDDLGLVGRESVEAVDKVLGVLVHRGSCLILGSGYPQLFASLVVLLGECLEVGTCCECAVDRVGSSLGCFGCLGCHLYLAILDRVGHLGLRHELHDVHGVVLSIVEDA